MKVFISWSGDKSHQIAAKLSEWLPQIMQSVKPYFTPNNIEKGARWQADISKELSSCNYGLIVLTKDNLQAPWIHFEAGALSKDPAISKVCPILFNLKPSDIEGPLSNFQLTGFDKEDMLKLVMSIYDSIEGEKVSKQVVNKTFETFWPDFQTTVESILAKKSEKQSVERNDRELLEEVLDRVRLISNRPAHRDVPLGAIVDLEDGFNALQRLNGTETKELNEAIDTLRRPISYLLRNRNLKSHNVKAMRPVRDISSSDSVSEESD